MDLFISGWTENTRETMKGRIVTEEHRINLLKAWELRKLKGKNT